MKQSDQREQTANHLFRARDWLTALMLICGLLITYKIWDSADRVADQSLRTVFDFRAKEATVLLQERLGVYGQVLRAGAGLLSVSPEVHRSDFKTFFQTLGLAENYPGVQGIGYAELIQPGELRSHVQRVRAEGYPDYTVWPIGERAVYTSIVYLEPFSGRNLRAFGYDMYSEPIRRAAMDTARDTGTLTVSGKVRLVQENGSDMQAGFLMYMPVYDSEVALDTISQRRAALRGWMYAPFRMDDFMRNLPSVKRDELDVEIYDSTTVDRTHLLYDENRDNDANDPTTKLRRVTPIARANHHWTVVISALPAYEQRLTSDRPRLLLQAGISISLLVALLTWLFLDDRARALQAADQALQLALYDTLTGLPNRKLLEERLRQTLANARRHNGRAALLFIDLDHFKPVNDQFGHAYGDLLLKEVALRLQGCVREADTASRLGGDEFVALLAEIESRRGVEVVAEKILQELDRPFEIVGQQIQLSASIGVAIYPENGESSKQLLQHADLAMYEAKHAGRGTVRFGSVSESSASKQSA